MGLRWTTALGARSRVGLVLLLVLAALPAVQTARPAPARADTPTPGDVYLQVQSARTVGAVSRGQAVPAYHWLIAKEDVGNPRDSLTNCLPPRAGTGGRPDFADRCQWPSTRSTPGAVDVVASGDQQTLSDTTSLRDLDPGRYLISVTADGYKIDGAHFRVDGTRRPSRVTVEMQPYPLPLGTVRIRVFQDSVPTDGTYEVGKERGLAGFTAHLSDVLGEVTTDYYGNPLCTTYRTTAGRVVFDANGRPVIATTGRCVSSAAGDIVIPNLGPNRYATQVAPPRGSTWYQTTTLEGGHDWDVWMQEGATGFDTEVTAGAERVPVVDFGFVRATPLTSAAAGAIKGVAVVGRPYIGGQGGQTLPPFGVAGANIAGPARFPLVALSDLDHNDQLVFMGVGGANGRFNVAQVPDGNYQLTLWDRDQELILWSFNVAVTGGRVIDVGTKMLTGWFTRISGSVFVDTNGNGKRDPGESGVPGFAVTLKERDNSVMDQGITTVTTDVGGNYLLAQSYPLGKWMVLEGFNTRYQTTGISYQADNQPTATTITGPAVDLSVLNTIGLSGRVDWGVQPYPAGTNGGIAGSVTYDTTRNELDPRYALTEPYQPGVPGIPVHLYAVVRDANGDPVRNADGSYQRGPELADTSTSETWTAPRGCTARLHNGAELTDQLALPDAGPAANNLCVESPMMGFQAGASDATDGALAQTVNGNYGFSVSKRNLYPVGDAHNPAPGRDLPLYADLAAAGYPDQPLRADDYLVAVDIPNDRYGRPLYTATREEDVNVFTGDAYLPQENFPPTAAQAANPGDPPAPNPTSGPPPSQGAGVWAPCAGASHTVRVTNAAFLAGGGSPFEGQSRSLCDQKLVTVQDRQASAPNFALFTEVPLPTHFWGITLNDLALSHDKRSVNYGENAGIPNVPVGIYDWSGRLVDTVETDFNGFYEALEPSTSTYNCPLPAGPCPNMYRFVGNDPGQPGQVNANYNPRFRTIAATFQAWPGLYTVTDTAPTQVAPVALAPGAAQATPVDCDLADHTPQIHRVSQPYARNSATTTITVSGRGFGANQGSGRVTLDGSPLPVTAWSDTELTVQVPAGTEAGPRALAVTADNGERSVNGLTVQVLGAGYNPRLLEVGPGKAFTSIQPALELAARTPRALVVVWPGAAGPDNPHGAYFENVVMHSPVKLQGVGPGGVRPDGSFVAGSEINGLGFSPDQPSGQAWLALMARTPKAGPRLVPDAAVVTVLATRTNFTSGYRAAIDGFTLTGGAQSDFATNVNVIGGGTKTPYGAPGAAVTQGGGIYVHAFARHLQITDNIIVGNSGTYAGAIRVGTPYAGDSNNDSLVISRNRIRDNGGTNLAGAVGLFTGSSGYTVEGNDLCGNFSAEYGGAISHFGRSDNGVIRGNRIWFNQSYDEGGGILVAGQLPATVTGSSPGSGPVTLDANIVQANLANDDGGGIRLLMPGRFPVTLTNNMVVGNISAHEGGGIALDDAPDVRIVNNTVMDNVTTATAVTSNGQPAPSGLSTAYNSDQLQATLPAGAPRFSRPLLFNNVFWNNRAGSWNGAYVTGIGDPTAPAGDPVNRWDMGVADPRSGADLLTPTYTLLQDPRGVLASATNLVGADPQVRSPFPTTATILPSRTYPAFREAVIVAAAVPPTRAGLGDYHLAASSPALDRGTSGRPLGSVTVRAPERDIDGDLRSAPPDLGADELR